MLRQFISFADILAHLNSLGLFHMDMRLKRMAAVLDALGLSVAPFAVVQILGTNGKGSTAAFLSSIATAHGVKTGRYTSPHFVSPTERICINGLPVPGDAWVEPANRILSVAQDLTYFEFLTVLALLLFREAGVELAVLEAGLGGRHDATTAVHADLLCYTPIAMDHEDVLGNSISSVAQDKAAAIRSPAPVCTAHQFPIVRKTLCAAAHAQGAELIGAPPLPHARKSCLGLQGPYQLVNAGLALCAWQKLAELLGRSPEDRTAQVAGLGGAFIPGRMQSITTGFDSSPLLLDGAHNPHGTLNLINALSEACIRPAAMIFSCLDDKNWRPSVRMLRRYNGIAPVYIPQLDNPRAADVGLLEGEFNAAVPPVAQALRGREALVEGLSLAQKSAPPGRPILVTGSLYLLAACFSLYPQALTANVPTRR